MTNHNGLKSLLANVLTTLKCSECTAQKCTKNAQKSNNGSKKKERKKS